jgi:hypothetical protein
MMMIKPWQAQSNKAPGKGGNEEQRERTLVQARGAKPKVGSKGHKNKCSSAPIEILLATMLNGNLHLV